MFVYGRDDIGAALTTGNVGKLSAFALEARETLAKIDGMLADLDARISRIERQRDDDEMTRKAIIRDAG